MTPLDVPHATVASVPAATAHQSALVLEGTCEAYGAAGTFRLVVETDGRFLLVRESPLPERLGFDGRNVWASDWSGMPRTLGPGESRAESAGIFAWARRPLGAEFLEAARVRLEVDGTTGAPRTLTRTGLEGTETWTYASSIEVGGLAVPRSVNVTVNGAPSRRFDVTRATTAPPSADPAFFARPADRPRDARFDRAIPARLPITRARTGHVLVPVAINGADPALFILDTGAGGSAVVDPTLLATLEEKPVGTVPAIGVHGVMHMPVRRGSSLRIGPVTIDRPFLLEQDLSFLAAIHDEPVLGILGYDLFARVVAVLDLGAETIELHDPAAAPDSVVWEPLTLELRVPQVPATYEGGRSGRFRIDIGAAGPGFGNVAFHTPTVRAERLLENRALEHAQLGADAIAFGVLDYFELGGCRFDRPTVAFADAGAGPLADPDTSGNLGVDFLKPFRLVLDYSRDRFAFERKECPKWTNAGHPDPGRNAND